MKYPDPFAVQPSDPFYPNQELRGTEFAQPDSRQSDLMTWLQSAECQREYRQLTGSHEEPTPSRPQLPPGCYLQPGSERGVWQLFVPAGGFRYDVYKGSREEMLQIVANLELSNQ